MNIKNRNYLLDNLKGGLIFLVVFGHSMELMRDKFVIARIIYIIIYFFHMPVFVFISGYFSKNINKGRNSAAGSLFLIFLVFNTIWNSMALAAGEIDFFSFLTPGWALWYILSMFLWRMLLPDLLKIRNIFILSLIFGIAGRLFRDFGTMMSLSRTITFLPFFLAGYYTQEKNINKIRENSKVISVAIVLLVILLSIYLGISNIIPTEILWGDRPYNNFNLGIGISVVAAVVAYIIGFLFIYALINLCPKKKSFVSKIGKNTLPVYILHTYLVLLIIAINSLINNYFMDLIIAFVGSMVITFLLSRDYVCCKFNKLIRGLSRLFSKKRDIKRGV